ncbi:MAG: V-type ATPase subunit [Nitrospinota bacterium]|nr:V-type ATPase subunit [Nitrospinota bacterium]
MLVEYANTRLGGLRSQFPAFALMERMAAGRDGQFMARALAGTVFEPEIAALTARKDITVSIPLVLRLVNEGSLRIKRLFAARAAEAWPQDWDIFVARWELEEIKAAVRYLTFGGADLEKRFFFLSYILPLKRASLWNAHMKPVEFQTALARAGHPLARALDVVKFAEDPVMGEFFMERHFFNEFLNKHKPKLGPRRVEYFRDQLDTINAKNGWLLRQTAQDGPSRSELFIKGGGRIGLDDFLSIAATPSEKDALSLIQSKMKLRLDPEKLDSPYGLSTALKTALLNRYRRMHIANPGGAWGFFLFIEELDAMIADVKNAIYCGATCSTVDVVSRRFIGARMS